ncbi:sugar ABC transporter ATP-binding protein [Lichenihabitans sp. Uapishka_5]|uniref:sugar ABC transporter ATP-binding protein n=1 Tax=Lichenihabitans sp. Uapishka_5 TaxID=3037302 RepID=UPI0029E7CB7E|nr:sugar ABC transporter ATP-binding protein [Lichenihabitans sp. Uapishka_5]MDX7951952.1 sugar ABC transporter ATP-binding protein [Lichenihabitans sp. Uapishka_5]
MSERSVPAPGNGAPVLEMRNISKTFPGVKALNNVQLTVLPGEIHALMGENGAGKSTLMKILSGAYQADPGGTVSVGGVPLVTRGPLESKAAGISIIYQELALSPNLTVAENIYLGREPRNGGFIDRATMSKGAAAVLARLGASFGPGTIVATLSIAERQLVEIARAVHSECRILVMDEPTTALSSRETDRLFALVRQLRADGIAIIYISHRMAEVYELSDRVSILRDGTYVGTLEHDAMTPESVVKMMVGRDLGSFYKKNHHFRPNAAPVLEVRHMGDGRRVKDVSFELHAGEVLGLAGLVGAGRTELARMLFGADRHTTGEVVLGGKTLAIKGPQDAIDAGLVYLTEDRKAEGVLLDMSVKDNLNLMICGKDARSGILDRSKMKARAKAAIQALSIRVASPEVNVGSLSGGNQQKVLLSRLLETKPLVLILDEPTRGVDIGAKSEIYRIIDELAKAGAGVLVISSELPEVIGIADRVLVMREGHLEGSLSGEAINQESIIALATAANRDIAKAS